MPLLPRFLRRGGSDHATCEELRELFSDLIDDEADEEVARSLRAHLNECKDCAAWLASLETTVQLLNEMPKSPATDKVVRRIREAIAAERSPDTASG